MYFSDSSRKFIFFGEDVNRSLWFRFVVYGVAALVLALSYKAPVPVGKALVSLYRRVLSVSLWRAKPSEAGLAEF